MRKGSNKNKINKIFIKFKKIIDLIKLDYNYKKSSLGNIKKERGIIHYNLQTNRIIQANHAACFIYGYSIKEFLKYKTVNNYVL